MGQHSYLQLAELDFEWAKRGMNYVDETAGYNKVVVDCSQACEKYLKSLIMTFKNIPKEELNKVLHSHNCRTLFNKASEKYKLPIDKRDCTFVGDFYFTSRYPGDDYINATKSDCEDCIFIVEKLSEFVRAELSKIDAAKNKDLELLKDIQTITKMNLDEIYSMIPTSVLNKYGNTKEECVLNFYKENKELFK